MTRACARLRAPLRAVQRHRDGAVGVEHDRVAALDGDAADLDRLVEGADDALVRALDANIARPDREAYLPELVQVAHGRVDEDGRYAVRLRLGREQLADERHGLRARHRQDETSPGCACAIAA